jgi:hypothetical protein
MNGNPAFHSLGRINIGLLGAVDFRNQEFAWIATSIFELEFDSLGNP